MEDMVGLATSKGSSAPDPYVTSTAQTQSNQQTANYNAALNRVDTYTPYGNSVYSTTGTTDSGAPAYRQDITLSPLAQEQLGNQQKQDAEISKVGFALGDQIKAGLSTPIDGEAGTRQAAQDAYYRRQTAYLDPQYANSQHDLDAKLANQGVMQGSTAYGRAQDQLARQKTFAYGQAQDQAIGQGASAQQIALANALTLRNSPYNELASIRSATPIQNPTFQATAQSNANPTDVAGNIYKSYGQDSANANAMMNGLFSMASTAAMASDRRLKRDIERVGETPLMKLPLYAFRYLWSDILHVGVMSDEVRAIMPAAVVRYADGFDRVNYAALA